MYSRRHFLGACACCAAAGISTPLQVIAAAPALSITPLAPGIWRHTSWKLLDNGAPFPSHGLIVKGTRSALLIDTTWPTDDMEPMIAKARELIGKLPLELAVTHAHDDRMSGVAIARSHGIRSYAHKLTREDAPKRGLPVADETWSGLKKQFQLGDRTVELFYPGPGHARDNVVAFVEDAGVLFGGCMFRSSGLGNIADADLTAWPTSMDRVISEYGSRTKICIAGHAEPAGPEMLSITRKLVGAAVRQKS